MNNDEFNEITTDVISKSIFSKLKMRNLIDIERMDDDNEKILEYLINLSIEESPERPPKHKLTKEEYTEYLDAQHYILPPINEIMFFVNIDNKEVIINKLKKDISNQLFICYNMNLFLFDGHIKKVATRI